MPQVPISRETSYFGCTKGLAKRHDGTEALVFIDLTGHAHMFPFEDEDGKKELVRVLTGGIETASSLDLPPGVRS